MEHVCKVAQQSNSASCGHVPSLSGHPAFVDGKGDLSDTGGSLCSMSAGMCVAGHPRPRAPHARQ